MLTANKSSQDLPHLREVEANSVESLVERRLGPGMLVIAPPLRLVHMNQAAWEFMQDIGEEVNGQGHGAGQPYNAKGLLPGPLRDLCLDIMKHFHDRPSAKDWERFEMKRLIGQPQRPILLRGFGVPDASGSDQSRVVLLLEEVGRRREAFRQDTVERLRLTAREQAVVQCLAKGWTNKEIGAALKLALPTVKEHIRHIMEKTQTNTRTGILVQIFHK